MTNRQLLLKLRPEGMPTLDNFVVGANGELIQRLRQFGGNEQLYLWGETGSGRTHLLTAIAKEASLRPVVQLAAGDIEHDLDITPSALIVIDDVERLSAAGQAAMFRLLLSARQSGFAVLLSGSVPPRQLTLREDLRTRIGQMLVYEIKALSDEEKSAAIRHYAEQRGLPLDDAVVRYLLARGRRDLPSLLATIDRLDEISLAQQRPPTLPLLRELMQMESE